MERPPRSLLPGRFEIDAPGTAAKTLIAYVAAVLAISVLTAHGLVSPTTLAASPSKVAAGRLWLLFTSGLEVQGAIWASVFSLAVFAVVTARVTGPKVALLAGAAGHVLSAVIAYALLAGMHLGQPWRFGTEIVRPDYGVSAVCAAWLGAASGTLWLTRPSRGARAVVVLASVAVAATAYRLHPGVDVIASEHVFACGIGLAVALPELRRGAVLGARRFLFDPWRRIGLDPVLGLLIAGIVLVTGVAVAPAALATASAVAADRPASVGRCISSWDASWLAPRALVAASRPVFAVVRRVPRRERQRTFHDCSIVFYGGVRTLNVRGRWSHGRVSAWHVRTVAHPPAPPANAKVLHANGIRLRPLETGSHR